MTISAISCPNVIPGCQDCLEEFEYDVSRGHVCDPPDARFVSTCELYGQMKRCGELMHRSMHKPVVCQNKRCRAVLNDRKSPSRELIRACRAGCCTEWYCPECKLTQSSAGPVMCPSCGWGRDPKLAKIRSDYRRRRRGRW